MFCPTCQTVVRDGPGVCPACGGTLRGLAATDEIDEIEVVEVIAELMPDSAPDPLDGDVSPDSVASTALAVRPASRELSPALSRAGQFAVAAWRQPAVRAAVKTGASAVALSLAMRIARQALASPSARRTVVRDALPSLSDLFHSGNETPGGRYVVVETYIYMRRVVVRR